MAPLGFDLDWSSHLCAYDLAHDPTDLVGASFDELREKMLDGWGKHVFTINTSACPFVARHDMSQEKVADRLGYTTLDRLELDPRTLHRHLAILRRDRCFADRVRKAFKANRDARKNDDNDVDFALYGAFVPDGDRQKLDRMLHEDPKCANSGKIKFGDTRLPELVFRYRARNFPDSLRENERAGWLRHCRHLHLEQRDEQGLSAMDRYRIAAEKERGQHPDKEDLLTAIEDYGDSVFKELVASVREPIPRRQTA